MTTLPLSNTASWRELAMRPVAATEWDGLLRSSGAIGILAILLVQWSQLETVRDLAVFFSLTLFVNGPYSPLLPFGFEPILLTFGQLYPPLLVAVLGVVAQVLVELINFRLYHAALRTDMMSRARESRMVRTTIKWFAVQPFLTTFVCALTPIPFWIVRIAAPLAGYSLPKYLTAMALGRLPRLWFYAALGSVLPFDGSVILGVGFAATVLAAVVLGWRHLRAMRTTQPVS